MTTILLDTNAYLRLAKRVRPLLAASPFNRNKAYELVVLREVAREVNRNPRLRERYPWFDDAEFVTDRAARALRFSATESKAIASAQAFLLQWVAANVTDFTAKRRSPPGEADCLVVAVARERRLIVATDDEGMLVLCAAMEIDAIRCCDVLHRLWAAKRVSADEIVAIYGALHRNADLPEAWRAARTTLFAKLQQRLTDAALEP